MTSLVLSAEEKEQDSQKELSGICRASKEMELCVLLRFNTQMSHLSWNDCFYDSKTEKKLEFTINLEFTFVGHSITQWQANSLQMCQAYTHSLRKDDILLPNVTTPN